MNKAADKNSTYNIMCIYLHKFWMNEIFTFCINLPHCSHSPGLLTYLLLINAFGNDTADAVGITVIHIYVQCITHGSERLICIL